MKDEDLTFKPNQKEYYAPDMSFTWFYRNLFIKLLKRRLIKSIEILIEFLIMRISQNAKKTNNSYYEKKLNKTSQGFK